MGKTIESQITILKYFQLIGVVIGLFTTGFLITYLDFDNLKTADLASVILMLLFFGLNFYVFYLFQNRKFETALKWMTFSLIIQLISISIDNFFYSAVNLIAINFKIDLSADIIIGLDFQFSHFMTTLSSGSSFFLLKINLIAIFMLFYVSNLHQELKTIKS